ncbi:acyl-CoA thioesterase FadM [Kitasatospora sp. GAS204A]|uniref:acyl-CoA thioesterase n=1 Tax=unclassified Kitasatospora TaxID=2633591 RepID=UPI002473C2B3|nr:thioesterase family protein [Kitasatospora sp. GAS204B]MDH6117262.1 acyl-CoA thioesterase FadM [Kitasatospora sp. GAS204B]
MIINVEHPVEDVEVDEFEVVHFANYVRWYGAALKEFLARYSEPAGFFGDGIEVRVARVRASYSSSARRDDRVSISISRVDNQGRSLRLHFRAEARGELLARAELNLVFVRTEPYGLVRVPQALAARLAAEQAESAARRDPAGRAA